MLAVLVSLLAQPLYTDVDSLDWMASGAEAVVRGRISDFVASPEPGRNQRHAVTMSVEETLKGEPGDTRKVALEIDEETLQRWKKDKVEVLLFPPCLGWRRGIVELDRPEVFTSEVQVLRERDQVLLQTREALARASKRKATRSHRLFLPGDMVRGTRWFSYYETSGGIDLVVPADERLEKRALEWLKPGLDPDSRNDQLRRGKAVRALAHFKSDPNIDIVRGLLKDPLSGVREEAYEVLTEWGIKAAKP